MYGKNLNQYVYVCPYCFNKVRECTCLYYPATLVQIDKNMLPIIKELNRKLYITECCCEGHIGENDFMYIEFKKNQKFNPNSLPKGFEYNEKFIKADITGKSKTEKLRKKKELLEVLYHWACAL